MDKHISESKRKSRNEDWSYCYKRLLWLLIVPAFMGLSYLASKNPEFVEKVYSQGIYPYINAVLSFVPSLLSISIAEFLIYAVAITIAVWLIVDIMRLIFRRISIARFCRFIAGVLLCAAILFCSFYMTWGFNYSRMPLSSLMSLDVHDRSVDELETLCYTLRDKAEELRKNVSENDNGVFALDASVQTYLSYIPSAYEALGSKYAIFSKKVYAAKSVFMSESLSYAGICGVYIPFTAEANINTHQPALLTLSSAAHETAHWLGFAREDEANFIAYLACISSDNTAIQYSGVMLALINCGNKLYAANQEKYSALYSSYSDDLISDLKNHKNYWDAHEGEIEKAFNTINDSYLKFNQQENGVKSYGMMVDLLLAYYAQ